MQRLKRRTRPTSLLAGVLTLGMASVAAAQWSGDPSAPLELGTTAPIGLGALELISADDGAVWVAWIDDQCFGAMRVQRVGWHGHRLEDGGLAFDLLDTCTQRTVDLVPHPGGGVSVSGAAVQQATPSSLHRIDRDGRILWPGGLRPALDAPIEIGALHAADDGSLTIAWREETALRVARFGVNGAPLWAQPAVMPDATSYSSRVLDLIDDGAGGVFVIWDAPAGYTRVTYANHVAASGAVSWGTALTLVPAVPGASRHTLPQACDDGAGGFVFVWTHGTESSGVVAPLRMQRVSVDGTLAFPAGGVRVALDDTPQYDVAVDRDESSGDLLLTWRDGAPVSGQSVRSQRLSLDGRRLWGPSGIEHAAIGIPAITSFDAAWNGSTLAIAITDAPALPDGSTVALRRVDGMGTSIGAPRAVSDAVEARRVTIGTVPGADIVSWMRGFGPNASVVAQRVNDDGSLGSEHATGDVDGDGHVGFGDLLAVLAAWGPCPSFCVTDLDDDGAIGFDDLLIVLSAWQNA